MTEQCNRTYGPDFSEQEEDQSQCTQRPDGTYCPPSNADKTCNDFQLSENKDKCLLDNYVNESLNIAGAPVHVFKLLGIHEQCRLVDATGQGTALSNGSAVGFPATNAFDQFNTQWRSQQTGASVKSTSYIGYDFGPINISDQSRPMYGVTTNIRKHITAFVIKQGSFQQNRVTRVRVERSDDGEKWYGVQTVPLPDDDCLNTIQLHHSVPNRYWRLRPVEFNGGNVDNWVVTALQFVHNFIATDIYNIQDKVLMENRDRHYAQDSLLLKASYPLQDIAAELNRYVIGYNSGFTIVFDINFSACVAILGRPLVIGDIIEVPSESRYSAKMRKILKWMVVTNVSWSPDGFTPGWSPTLLRVITQPAIASQETQDIFGDLAEQYQDDNGYVQGEDGNSQVYQDYFDVSQTIEAEAKNQVPERGRETSSHIRQWEQEELDNATDLGMPYLRKTGETPVQLYNEDAMPPNNQPFTEGDEFPESPNDKDYHRLTYSGLSRDIPANLYRYSEVKGRWIWLETDNRAKYNIAKPILQEYINPKTPETKRSYNHIVSDPDTSCDGD